MPLLSIINSSKQSVKNKRRRINTWSPKQAKWNKKDVKFCSPWPETGLQLWLWAQTCHRIWAIWAIWKVIWETVQEMVPRDGARDCAERWCERLCQEMMWEIVPRDGARGGVRGGVRGSMRGGPGDWQATAYPWWTVSQEVYLGWPLCKRKVKCHHSIYQTTSKARCNKKRIPDDDKAHSA